MDEIEKRLRDAADNCIKFYDLWRKNQKDGKAREEMMESVHELRKIAARLEIEMAISERDEMAAKPIPIPPHRSSRKRPGESTGHEDADNGEGNRIDPPQPQQNQNRPHGGHGGGHRGPRRSGGGGGNPGNGE